MNDFETWWYHEGSGPRLPGEDNEEHCKRMCKIAWSNGADKLLVALEKYMAAGAGNSTDFQLQREAFFAARAAIASAKEVS
jgi:hypothetical protein